MLAAVGRTTASSSNGDRATATEDSDLAIAAAETYDKFNGMTGQERTDELVACAEEEGQLNVYTSNTDMEDLIDVFSDQYDIEVNNYRAVRVGPAAHPAGGRGRLLRRGHLRDERARARCRRERGPALPLRGELRDSCPRAGPAERGLDRDALQRLRRRLEHRQGEGGRGAQDPRGARRARSGRAGLDGGLRRRLVHGAARLLRRGAGAERGRVHRPHDPPGVELAGRQGPHGPGRALSADQFDVAVSLYSHTVDKAADEAAPRSPEPASGEPVQPIISPPNGIGLVKTATNPCAAMLFVDFELTGGQDVFKEAFRVGSVEGATTRSARRDLPGARGEAARRPRHLEQGLRGRRRQRPGHRLSPAAPSRTR